MIAIHDADWLHFYGLMQKRCNSNVLAMELHLFCIKLLIWDIIILHIVPLWYCN